MTRFLIHGNAQITAEVELLDDGEMRIHTIYGTAINFDVPPDYLEVAGGGPDHEVVADETERIDYGLLSVRAHGVDVDHQDVVGTGDTPA